MYFAATTTAQMSSQLNAACEAGAFAAYSADCNQYLMCLWGKYQLFKCAPGLTWNKVSFA